MIQVEDLVMTQLIHKCSLNEIYLGEKNGLNKLLATKVINREIADNPEYHKYFTNKINILYNLKFHPNIVQLDSVKKTRKHYYIVMEYINGGTLSECLNKYKQKYNQGFPENVIKHLMKQIIETLAYIHDKNIIHGNLNFDHIMVKFDSDYDKINLNMMHARIKIINFGIPFIFLNKNKLTNINIKKYIHIEPKLLKMYFGLENRSLINDTKSDIWSIGTILYELLTGKPAFEANNLKEFDEEAQKQIKSDSFPHYFSVKGYSFLQYMLRYNSEERFSAQQLLEHPFITKSDLLKITYIKNKYFNNTEILSSNENDKSKNYFKSNSFTSSSKSNLSQTNNSQNIFQKHSSGVIELKNSDNFPNFQPTTFKLSKTINETIYNNNSLGPQDTVPKSQIYYYKK